MAKKTNKIQNLFIKGFGIDRYLTQWENNQKILKLNLVGEDRHEELENRIWFQGKGEKIEYFYKTILPHNVFNSQYQFWRVVNTNIPRTHYPLPGLISGAIGTLLFNQEIDFTVDAGAKVRNKALQDRLDEILDTNDILVLLQSAAAYQSYSGQVGLKINYDTSISDDPLITAYPKERLDVHSKYGQTIYIDFIDEYDGDYKLVSRYGLGYINYMLFHKEKRVELSELQETADLKDVAFFDSNGQIVPVMFAVVVNNKGKHAHSDYRGLIDTFHALDETYSALNNYIRRTKPNVFITEDIAQKDANGRPLPLNEFDNIITILDQAVGENNTRIDRELIEIKTQGYLDTINKYRMVALEKIGLSPATIGIDAAGANQSGEALNIRERASGRLREEKLSNWREQLDKFLYAVLMFDYIVHNSFEGSDGTYLVELPSDFIVKSNFGEYIKESLKERSETYLNLYEKGVVSLEFAIHEIFGKDLNEEELLRLVAETKVGKGIPLNELEKKSLETLN